MPGLARLRLATRFGLLAGLGLLALPGAGELCGAGLDSRAGLRLGCASRRLATASAVAIPWLGPALCVDAGRHRRLRWR